MVITDIIIACATGFGSGPRAMVRASGPLSHSLLQRVCRPIPADAGRISRARFEFPDGLSLPCLAIRFNAPHSYTGQDSFELTFPGNPTLVDRIVRRLIGAAESSEDPGSVGGVREAGPGEFSARAFLSGRISLHQAEGVAAIIAAQTEHQLDAARGLASGRTGEKYRAWSDELATLLSLVEAGIDFTDQEDVVPIPPLELDRRLRGLCASIGAVLESAGGTERPDATPRVVLVGRPNAGKSTLFNALLGRKRTVVSPEAGTTRDAVAEPLDLPAENAGTPAVMLVDLAGLEDRTGASAADSPARARALDEISRAAVIVLCDPDGDYSFAGQGVPAAADGRPTIRVRTKADLPRSRPGGGADRDAVSVCGLDGWNLGALRRAIADAAWGATSGGSEWLVPRHRRTLAQALDHLRAARAQIAVQPRAPLLASGELIADHLRAAADLFGELAGRISPDDIIGRVFATFCVGK